MLCNMYFLGVMDDVVRHMCCLGGVVCGYITETDGLISDAGVPVLLCALLPVCN